MNMRKGFRRNQTRDTCWFVHHVLVRLRRFLEMDKWLVLELKNQGVNLFIARSNTLRSFSSNGIFFGTSCTCSSIDKCSFPLPLLEGPAVEVVVSFRRMILGATSFLLTIDLEGVFNLGLEKIKVFSLSYELSTSATIFVGFGVVCWEKMV